MPDARAPEGGPQENRLLVIILDYNGIDYTVACLESLAAQTWRGFTVLVIDNGSERDDLDRVRAHSPAVQVLRLADNLGWAGGNNVGLRLAMAENYDYACLLNNDTVLDPDALEHLMGAFAALPEPCLLHPSIAYFDDPSSWQLRPKAEDALDGGQTIVAMDMAYGACLLVPVAVLCRIGLLDERFFLQLEETDFYLRARAAGLRSFCALNARILHRESVSFGGRVTPAKNYYQVRNRFLLAEKHAPTPAGFARTARGVLWSLHEQARKTRSGGMGWGRFACWLVSGDPLAAAAREGLMDYLRRRFGRRPERRRGRM